MFACVIAFLAGIVTLQYCHHLPPLHWLLLLLMPLLLFIKIAPKFRWALSLLLVMTLGFIWALLQAQWLLSWELPKNLEGKTITVTGKVSGLPQQQDHYVTFQLVTTKLERQPQQVRLKLSWYGRYLPIQAGERWQLQVRLKRPHSMLNPGASDYEKSLFQQHIRATGYVVASPKNRLLVKNTTMQSLNRLRQHIDESMQAMLKGQPLGGLLPALTVGSRNGITADQWQVFRATGTSHLVAISGLHIGLIAGFAFFLIGFLWRCIPNAPLWIATPQVAAIAALVAGLLYSGLAGFSVPTQRALIMITVFMSAKLMRRHLSNGHGLLLLIGM